MNLQRYRPFFAPAAILVIALLGALVPAMTPLTGVNPAQQARSAFACPSFNLPSAQITVAVTGAAVEVSRLEDPRQITPVSGVTVLRGLASAARVTGPSSGSRGATSGGETPQGPDRGLSLAACQLPATEWWFTGALSNNDATSDVVLVNLDDAPAVVDLAFYGPTGRLTAPGARGLRIEPRSQRSIAVAGLVTHPEPVAIHLTTSQGRVAAWVRQHTWAGTTPTGVDWLPPSMEPATSQVIAGVPAGAGARTLVVTNTGERIATVRISALGTSGRIGLVGLDSVDVPAGATRAYSLQGALQGSAVSLYLTSDLPVTASVVSHAVTEAARDDISFQVAAPALAADTVLPSPLTHSAALTLAVANTSDTEVSIQLTVRDAAGNTAVDKAITIPAGATVLTPLPGLDNPLITLKASSTSLYATLQATETFGTVSGLATLALAPARLGGAPLGGVLDPLAGTRS